MASPPVAIKSSVTVSCNQPWMKQRGRLRRRTNSVGPLKVDVLVSNVETNKATANWILWVVAERAALRHLDERCDLLRNDRSESKLLSDKRDAPLLRSFLRSQCPRRYPKALHRCTPRQQARFRREKLSRSVRVNAQSALALSPFGRNTPLHG